MKKLVLYVLAGAFLLCLLDSCAAGKKDCQGRKHYKQKGGFYM